MDSDDYYLFQCKDGGGKLYSAKPDSLELLLPNKKKPQILQVNNSGTGTHSWYSHSHVIVPAKDGAGFQNPNLNHPHLNQKGSFSSLSLLRLVPSPIPTSLSIYRQFPQYYHQITNRREEVKSQRYSLFKLFLGDRNPFPPSHLISVFCSGHQPWAMIPVLAVVHRDRTEGPQQWNSDTIREFGIYLKCKKYT